MVNSTGRTGGVIGAERKTCYSLCVVVELAVPMLAAFAVVHHRGTDNTRTPPRKMKYLCFSRRREVHFDFTYIAYICISLHKRERTTG